MEHGIPSYSVPSYGISSFGVSGFYSADNTYYTEDEKQFKFLILSSEDPIAPELYQSVSTLYGNVYKNLKDSSSSIDSAFSVIATMSNPEVKIELMKNFSNLTNQAKQDKLISNIQSCVLSLNNHVSLRSQKSLNEWLFEFEIKVTRDWADLCEQTGTVIEEINIL